MAKKKTKAGLNMIASVMEAATEQQAIDIKTNDSREHLDAEVKDEQSNFTSEESDILVKNQMEVKTEIKYDDVCISKDEIVRLTKENEQLKDKLTDYIDFNAKLEQNLQQLQKEYDESLMKISELSFEVAQLKTSLNELEGKNSCNASIQNNSNQKTQIIESTPVSYQYKNNGYSSWN